MRLSRVDFAGFKRLRDTGCNVRGRVIAFLGPNEAGKSSVLQGLSWLSVEAGEQMPEAYRARGADSASTETTVSATFVLDANEFDDLGHIETTAWPKTMVVEKTADGRLLFALTPEPRRPPEAFTEALAAAKSMRSLAQRHLEATPESETMLNHIETFISSLDRDDSSELLAWQPEYSDLEDNILGNITSYSIRSLDDDEVSSEQIEESNSFVYRNLESAADALSTAMGNVRRTLAVTRPWVTMVNFLFKRSPQFRLFSEGDRNLQSWYDLTSDEVQETPSPALTNLLQIAQTSLPRLLDLQQRGNVSETRTHLKRCNENLAATLDESWKQSSISVEININGRRLEIYIEERGPGGGTIAFGERSDGLRMYIAVACFLATRHAERPTILLIDEAETHLHLDAQADLIRTFYRMTSVEQVIYTTHSPGCLPMDLGTGVRLVEPDPARPDSSSLRNNFWRSGVPGYNPLLYAMGAGAAAFSALRRAVIVEGPADMILLPTLIRLALDVDQIDYQVAPGLSVAAISQVSEMESVAANVVYLADGDKGGATLAKQLRGAGIPESRILQMTSGTAVEDFVLPTKYLEVMQALIDDATDAFPLPVLDELPEDSSPIARRISVWADKNERKIPGKVAVAARLAENLSTPDIPVERQAELKQMHQKISTAFNETSTK